MTHNEYIANVEKEGNWVWDEKKVMFVRQNDFGTKLKKHSSSIRDRDLLKEEVDFDE